MKQLISLIITFVYAVALMPIAIARPVRSINTESEAVPFQASFKIHMTANGGTCVTSLDWNNTEPGQASYFSEPTAEGTFCRQESGPVSGDFIFKGDNGDAVFGTYSGPAYDGSSTTGVWDGTFAIAGGAGGFAGLTGSGTMRLVYGRSTSGSFGWGWTEFSGTISSYPSNLLPELLTQPGTSEAIALDSVTMLRAPFPVATRNNFSTDYRTRVMLFARYITLPADSAGARVTAQAVDAQNRVYSLPVEYVSEVPEVEGLIQLVVKLTTEIKGVGDVKVSITQRGKTSNKALLKIKP
jgi:hypothetical protein